MVFYVIKYIIKRNSANDKAVLRCRLRDYHVVYRVLWSSDPFYTQGWETMLGRNHTRLWVFFEMHRKTWCVRMFCPSWVVLKSGTTLFLLFNETLCKNHKIIKSYNHKGSHSSASWGKSIPGHVLHYGFCLYVKKKKSTNKGTRAVFILVWS